MKKCLNKIEKKKKFEELIDQLTSSGPGKIFSSKISSKANSINRNKKFSLVFDSAIEEIKKQGIKNNFISNCSLYEALIYKFGNSNKHQIFWKISLRIYRELKRINYQDDILGHFVKFSQGLKNSKFIYSPLRRSFCFFGAILLKRILKLDRLRLICAQCVDYSLGFVELGHFLTFNLMLIAIASDIANESNKQILFFANIYKNLPPIINFNLLSSIKNNEKNLKKNYNKDLNLIIKEIEGELNRREIEKGKKYIIM
ncbi:hypothetical protein Mgra_00002595 [Meloidogyne graminicola]|uniref:Nucleolus and neural progenitor protein-like N-terminal domain-containing protein n=1 Tax=Meloidogyne graminicola TaxID=189291 RepID=A0A8S9ZW52_9BILA|nr:hypothetical protein Mgra_00002595 [Meloidogyne graminicola]